MLTIISWEKILVWIIKVRKTKIERYKDEEDNYDNSYDDDDDDDSDEEDDKLSFS